ncbi:MAG: hypothetical protein GXP52_02585 [Deltaproteobacteria bacterium]|nr:hypothetical protein [Deltaproteobacteria bacterium]
MDVHLRGGEPLKYRGDVILLGHFSDVLPLRGTVASMDWLFNASVSRLWKNRPTLLDFGAQTLIPTQGKLPVSFVILMGLGKEGDFGRDLRREAYRMGIRAMAGLGAERVATEEICMPDDQDLSTVEEFYGVVAELADLPVRDAALFITSPETLSAAKASFPRRSGAGTVPDSPNEATG